MDQNIIAAIRETLKQVAPTAKVILFGSYARGDQNDDSDIDILVLIEKEKLTYEDTTGVTFAMMKLEARLGVMISPLVYSRRFWENPRQVTPFYESVKKEGILL